MSANLLVPSVPRSALIRHWSVEVDELKEQSNTSYDLWLFSGKPRPGDVFEFVKSLKYKY